ncbi:MAG: LPS export ABC transporter ATP-binding protein [Candidatus Competibacterales bacterium]
MVELVAREIVKRYRRRKVVDAVSLGVKSGEVVGLLGPNGAGKTTSFYVIVGLTACDEGRVTLGGRDITRLPMHTRARLGLGYLPQEPSVFRKLTVEENVLAILETRKGLDRKARKRRAEALLRELDVWHLKDQQGISLSGGERRRVEVARALAAEPRFMLLDEPFAGVDPLSVKGIQEIIVHLSRRGIGVLITDHSVAATLSACHRVYILNEGRVIAEGSPDQILENEQARRVYLGDGISPALLNKVAQ